MPPVIGDPLRFQLLPADYSARLDLGEIFGRSAPLEFDAGCGAGKFLVARAALHPDRDFLGTERLKGRVRTVCEKAARNGLSNLRVIRLETVYTLQWLLPPGSVSILHVSFPDPWPKRRHHRRRLISPAFLQIAAAVLEPQGELRLATDHEGYFTHMLECCNAAPGFRPSEWHPEPDYPHTDFETRFRQRDIPVYRARFVKSA